MLHVMTVLREAIACDAWCIATVDPATLMLTSSMGEGFPMKGSGRFLQIEYAEADFNKYADLAHRRPPVGLLSEATEGDFARSVRWREINEPAGLHDELRAAFVVDGACWGALDLLRSPASGNFIAEEVDFIAGVSAPIAAGVRAGLVVDNPAVEDVESGPGLVILSDDLHPVAISTAAEHWLGELKHLESEWMGPLPNAIYSVAARLRDVESSEPPSSDLMPRARVRLQSGRWLAVQASRLTTAAGVRQVAVIIEPPEPAEIAHVIVTAYSLTSRESQIVRLVVQGLSTKETARALAISPLTVQQHLKIIFDKVGVHSRGELVGRIFDQQYLPRIKAGRGLGPDGWFVE